MRAPALWLLQHQASMAQRLPHPLPHPRSPPRPEPPSAPTSASGAARNTSHPPLRLALSKPGQHCLLLADAPTRLKGRGAAIAVHADARGGRLGRPRA